MKVVKQSISDLTLCYCVAPLVYQGAPHFLVASEKEYACLLFDRHGNLVDEVWAGPGGTMSAVQVPGVDGAFLATHKFYSPNNCKEARIVLCRHTDAGWQVRTVADLPYVHRFDILSGNGTNYLLACCLKSGYEGKDDWRFPGMTLACELPGNLMEMPEGEHLRFSVLKEGMFHNHGYNRTVKDGRACGLVASDEGVFRFIPPKERGASWGIEQLIFDPTSDVVMLDFDGDGKEELLTLSPFHGDQLRVYRKDGSAYKKVFEYEKRIEFAHALCTAVIDGETMAIVGHRKGERDLLAVRYANGSYLVERLDHDVGPANVMHMVVDVGNVLVSANREINEVAYYEISRE